MKIPPSLNALLITKRENIRYLTGFDGSRGMVLLTKKGNFLMADNRYAERAQKCVPKGWQFQLFDEKFQENFGKNWEGKIGIEDSVTLLGLKSYKKLFPKAKFKPVNQFVEDLRRKKTEEEIKKIRIAQQGIDRVLIPFMRSEATLGVTEKALAFRLDLAIRDEGRFDLSFDPIVAFGANSSIPHHAPSETKLKKGDNILIDCGAKFEGYHSDMTRNFVLGKASTEYQNKYEHLLNVQQKTLQKYQAGKTVKSVMNFCRKALGDDAPYFTHGLGHGVGLEIHEIPSLSEKSKHKLEINDVVTCEPGIYYPGKFGIRIEDLLVIRKDEPEILSKTEKELITL